MKRLTLILLFLLTISSALHSQSGVKFDEFVKKIQPYFDDELIEDVRKEMPKGNFTVWGWAVGDYSGDGYHDVAFSTRIYSDRKKVMKIFLFVDMDGYLVKIAEYDYKYQNLPLEVGVIIRDNTCLLTKKNREFDWEITGYRFDNGAITKVDEYKIRRIKSLTYESYNSYDKMQNKHKYFQTASGKVRINAKYLTIPCYYRNRYIYKGFSNETYTNDIDFVPAGAYYWDGDEDLSYRVSSWYDKDYLYFDVHVKDDKIITDNCSSCIYESMAVWLDLNKYDENNTRLVKTKRNSIEPQRSQKSGLYYLKFAPGDFIDIKANLLEFNSSDELTQYQREKVNEIIVSAGQYDTNYYLINIKIPKMVLGLESLNLQDGKLREFGCTVMVYDSDNPYNQDEVTELATSKIDPRETKSFGTLLFIPDGKWHGDVTNIYRDKVIENLKQFGF